MKVEQDFSKGMATDLFVQPPGTAKNIENFELIQLDGTNYAIRTANGISQSFSVNPNYEPIGWYKISNKFMIHSAYCGTGGLTNGELGYVTVDKSSGVATYLPIYNHADLLHTQAHQIEGMMIPENEKIERAYWSDNDQPPRSLNYFSKKMTTYITSGSIVNGTKYMVVRGRVEYPVASGNFYGPNETLGTVFTGGVTATYTGTLSPLVIEYVNVNLLEFSPTHALGFIRFNKWIPGSLYSKSYMYCYRVGTYDGYFTPFSYVTRPIHVGSPAPTTGNEEDYQDYQGHLVTTATNMGIQIAIEGIDTNFERIQVVAIPCTEYEVNEDPVLVYDSGITGSSMTFDHTGSLELQTLLLEDVRKILTNIRKLKTLTALNNTHFIGNITTQKDSAWAFPGATIECAQYLVPTNSLWYITDNGVDPAILSLIGLPWSDEAIANQLVYHGQWYKVVGGIGDSVTYNAIVYNPGDTFQGDVEYPTYTPGGAGYAVPIIRLQQYSGTFREIEITDDWLDNKGQLTPSLIRSNWRTEKYRYGILLYHNNGNPVYVKWLGDKTMPAQSDNPGDIDPETGSPFNVEGELGHLYEESGGTYKHYTFANLGVKISNIDFQGLADDLGISLSDLPKIYSGFSIVRCPRDEQIVAQGILFGCNTDGNGDIRPTVTVKGAYDIDYNAYGQHTTHFVIYSPEFNFNFPGFPSVRTNDILRLETYMEDFYSVASEGEGQLETSNYHWFNYFIKKSSTSVAAPAEFDLQAVKCLVVEAGATRSIPNTANAYVNGGQTAGFSAANQRQTYGNKALFIATQDVQPFGDTFNQYGYAKPIVSIVRKKANLYGGTTAAALATNVYQTTGHYQAFDADFISYLNSNSGLCDDVEVFGGDCFLNLFDIARMMKDNDAGATLPGISYGMCFPVESKINLALREGRHIAKTRSYENGIAGRSDGVSFASPSQLEKFVYNTAFSNDGKAILYTHAPENYRPQTREPYHVRFTTPPKTPGETLDSFLNFLPANYRVVETQAGEINNLRSKMQRLFYWQDSAVGTIAVNERIQVASDIGAALTLGSGQTAERHDERTRFYGNKHQWSLCETEDGFGWYNIDHDAIVHMSVGMKITEVNMVKNIDTYLKDHITGDIRKTDNPVGHLGIVSCYESKYKRMMFSFKNQGDDRALLVNMGDDLIIGGVFTISGGLMIDFNEDMYLTANEDLSTIQPSTSYSVNSRVEEGDGIYICILAFTTTGSPTNPSADATHWSLLRKKSNVYVDINTELCKFFGIVVESTLQFVVNENFGLEKIFDTFEWTCSEVFFKSLTVNTRNQSATDSDISTNDEYDYFNNTWYSNVPLDTSEDNGQMQDNQLIVTVVQNNIDNGIVTQAKDEKLTLMTVKTEYRKAY